MEEVSQSTVIPYLQSHLDSCCSEKSFLVETVSTANSCLLQATGFNVDALTADIRPTYGLKDPDFTTEIRTHLESREENYEDFDYDDLDFSNISYPSPIWNRKEEWEVAVKSVAVAPVVFVAVVGNLALIGIILKAHLLRHAINLFILNMSVANLLLSLLFPWTMLVEDLYQSWILGEVFCKAHGFILVTLMLVSVFSLTFISYDRLRAVVLPFRPKMDARAAKCAICLEWIAAMASASPLIFWRSYHEREWKDFHEKWCNDRDSLKLYWLILLIFLVWIPLLVLFLTYAAVLIKLENLEKHQKDHSSQVKKSHVVRTLFTILILFILCWAPFTSFVYISNTLSSTEMGPTWLPSVLFASHYLILFDSAANPIVYGLKNDNWKREMRLALSAFFKNGYAHCLKCRYICSKARMRQQNYGDSV